MNQKTTFWSLLKESIIVQSIITLMMVSAITYLYLTGREVPETLYNLTYIIVGYWLGSKAQHTIEKSNK